MIPMTRKWPHDLKGLREIARNEILPEWEADDEADPTRNWPKDEWLVDNGFSSIKWILREKHDLTPQNFFIMIVGVEDADPKWDIGDPETVKRANEFLDKSVKYRDWADSTERTTCDLLNRVFREIVSHFEDDEVALIEMLGSEQNKTETYDNIVEIMYRIKKDAKSDDSAYQYVRTFQRFVEFLERRCIISYNLLSDIDEEFRWDRNQDGSSALTAEQIRALWDTAESLEEYLVIIGYIIWGVRRKELPSISQSQIDLSADPIQIEFAESDRKNGSGTVDILFGGRYIKEQIDRLNTFSNWEGDLLVDKDDKSQPMDPADAADIFQDLCERADIRIDGELPTPNNGRAVWHDYNAKAEALLHEMNYTDDQDLVDDDSPRRYHSPETKEKVRQMLYLERFKKILPETAYSEESVFLRDVQNQYELDENDWDVD